MLRYYSSFSSPGVKVSYVSYLCKKYSLHQYFKDPKYSAIVLIDVCSPVHKALQAVLQKIQIEIQEAEQ